MNTEMQIINVVPGSPEWHAHRQDSNNASDVPAAKGVSPYTTRNELLKRRDTGISPEVDPATQRRFDAGHSAEAAARPFAEKIIGEELFPATGIRVVDGVRLSASFDGLTMMGSKIFECKLWNEGKAAFVRDGMIPPQDHGQVVQQLVISKADACLYMVSDGTEERTVHTWVTLQEGDEKDLLATWRQFEQDLESYEHTEAVVAPVAASIEALPAVMVQVSGSIAIVDNFKLFGVALHDFLDNKLVKNPQTDQDFANLESQIKMMKKAEDALDAAEANMIAQVSSVDEAKRTKDMLRKLVTENRIMAEKLLKAEKENRRAEIVRAASLAMNQHVAKLNERIGGNWMPVWSMQVFNDAIKGMKSLDSMRDKLASTLANEKIAANELADRIELNQKALTVDGANHNYLVHDFAQICTKAPEDFAAIIAQRIAKHKADDAARIEAERVAAEAKTAAAVAAAVEAERMAEAKRVAEQAATVQRGKEPAECSASLPAAVSSTPPITAQDAVAARHDANDEAAIDDFIALLPMTDTEKRAHRLTVLKWEKYRIALLMKVAA